MNRLKEILSFLGGIVLLLTGIATAGTGAFFASRLLFRHFGTPSSAYVEQLIIIMLTFLFLIVIMGTISLFTRGREKSFYIPIITAIRQIAKGDFKITLENPRRFGQFGEIVEGINEMASELSRMEGMRQDFISSVSHEIQSPLTSIRGFARALRNEGIEPEKRSHYLDIIEAESTRLSGLSDNLLKLSALEEGSFPFERKPYRLDKQIREIILACEPQWLEKGLEVEAELQEVKVSAVEDLMSQVWGNLLHNSIKFTPRGGSIRIEMASRGTDGIEVMIKDSGIGIGGNDLPRIFDRFYKADQARSSAAGGSGLGLSLVKKIVEIHGGTVTAESRPGEGTAFKVSLTNGMS
ncbi:sensor histidine kinase [Paenibacillus sp. sgz500958]|uniref:sensor histidine kinase n=1 Tax=Paenibacillus sp. sgz500958 TaxID=3242475 RepID=UPI0036D4294D